MVQVALVGCGHIHTPGFVKRLAGRPDVKVKYVWDHQPARAAAPAEALGGQVVQEVEAIWADPAVEAVIICSETNRHEELVLAAAAAGKHMFVEKPLGMGAADAYRMADAIEQARVLFQTGYFMRGEPIHRFLREQITAGAFGQISRIRHTNCHAGSLRGYFDTEYRWMADISQAGLGGFGDLGTHSLDILLWLMGDVSAVTAETSLVTARYGECDESGEGLLLFQNGVLGSIAAGWVDVSHPIRLIISGTEGHAYVLNNKLYFQSSHVAGATGEQPWETLPEPWPHAFELFLDAVNGQDAPLVTAREAAVRSSVMEAFYRGAATRSWVTPI
jgi:predicted dehydrogenase